jgi:hypothetical protein
VECHLVFAARVFKLHVFVDDVIAWVLFSLAHPETLVRETFSHDAKTWVTHKHLDCRHFFRMRGNIQQIADSTKFCRKPPPCMGIIFF